MLVRPTVDDSWECIQQQHHALLSGFLAGAWFPTSLDPLLVQAIGLHDDPWRPVDAEPAFNPETGLPFDFVEYPLDAKIDFYRAGIDALESLHPWVAYLVSRHYTTFAGTRDAAELTEPEARRRERLEERLSEPECDAADGALRWMKYFDVFSLYVSLAGPAAREDSIPTWLRDPADWSEAPDETPLEIEWRDDATVELEPWPFSGSSLEFGLEYRPLDRRFESAREFESAWNRAAVRTRRIEFVRR